MVPPPCADAGSAGWTVRVRPGRGDLIADNPPPPHDAGLLGLFAQIGLTVDHGFDPTTLDEPTRRGLERAVADGEDMIAAAAQGLGSEMNGWQLPPVATEYFGTDYLYRAAVGWQSMYVNDPIEAYYPPIYTDLDGAQLDGSTGSYEIRFPAGHLPPVDAFWSITLYDLEKRLMVANDIERFLERPMEAGAAPGQPDMPAGSPIGSTGGRRRIRTEERA